MGTEIVYMPMWSGFLWLLVMVETGGQAASPKCTANIEVIARREGEGAQPTNGQLVE